MATGPAPPPDLNGPDYPRHWEGDVVLSDGGTMHIRPIRGGDGALIQEFHERQSPESIYFRYFSPRPRLTSSDIDRLTTVDYIDRMAFVGLIDGALVGVARYDRHPARSVAEVAFFVDDRQAGRGIATVLLEYLAAAARDVGLAGFTAQVLPSNRRMLGVFKQVGFEVTSRFSDGVIEVEFPIEPTPDALAAMEERATRAEARSVARLLAPRSVAVVGASRREGTLGHAVFRRLMAGGFAGPAYPVNPEAPSVASVRAYASVMDVPDDLDLAVLVVPAAQVHDVVEECGRKRVQGLVVVSAGFGEIGPAGVELEGALVEQARRLGVRLIGPNTMGVVNTAPDVRLVATFADVRPAPGVIGFSTQSGTIGAAVLRRFAELDLGISSFVAMGNKADVSGNDLLRYWEDDPRTDVVVLYLESFGNPRNFARIARRVGKSKPIVAVKAGRTAPVGPGEPIDGPGGWSADGTVDAMLEQTGVIRVDTLDQLFDVTRVLVDQPIPAGPRVAILSNVWGPAVLARDACLAAGLELADVTGVTDVLLDEIRPGARIGNPLELSAESGPREFGTAVRALLDHDDVDSVLVLHAPDLHDGSGAVAHAVGAAAAAGPDKPVVASFLGAVPSVGRAAGSVPVFVFPESASYALGRAARYAGWRARQTGSVPDLPMTDGDASRALAADLLARHGPGPVALPDAIALLATHGIAAVAQREAATADEAVAAADEVGWPVALKAGGLARPAKTEAGGVAVDVFEPDELRASFVRMAELHGAAMYPTMVQAMAQSGFDCWVELHQDPALGSVLAVGPVGAVESVARIIPLTDADAARLVDLGPLAAAVVDAGPPGRAAAIDLFLRVSALADALPELASLRLDPVIVSDTAAVTNIRLTLAPWEPPPAVRRI